MPGTAAATPGGAVDKPTSFDLPLCLYTFYPKTHEFGWPREESNLRTQIRSLLLYPLSYGAGPI